MRIIVLGQALITESVAPRTNEEQRFVAWIGDADAVLTNLEASIAPDPAWPMKDKTVHTTTRSAIQSLAAIGVTHVSLANNHAWDYGPAGVVATAEVAASEGLIAAGAGVSLDDASGPRFCSSRDGPIAFIAFDLGPSPEFAMAGKAPTVRPGINSVRVHHTLETTASGVRCLGEIARAAGYAERKRLRLAAGYDSELRARTFDFYGVAISEGAETHDRWHVDEEGLARIEASIRAARENAEAVVVSFHSHHWSPNWGDTPEWLESLCRRLSRAGADVVFGHGPPVALGHEIHHGHPIFYGLGNLIFHTRRPDRYRSADIDVWHGLAAEITIDVARKSHSVDIRRVGVARLSDSQSSAPRLLD